MPAQPMKGGRTSSWKLIRGVPITEYCDRNHLTIPERLDLFSQVCQAIQHAHQKGIIHRDIKPSNVLVTLHDGKPVPKVIDFGIAKALNTRLTDKTIYTEHFQVVGTLLYMSPEQAELSGLDIDTRSDIYSLGVLLYELLTGTTPFQKDELNKAGFDEQRRIIREQEPPRASIRISSLGASATTVAQHRKTDAKKLCDTVRGDLDWVVLKSMEKDRTRRYESADALSKDLERYLANDPVDAHPPSMGYQLRKVAVRYQAAIAVAGAIALVLTLSVLVTARQAGNNKRLREVAEKNEKEARRTLEELKGALMREAVEQAFSGDVEKVDTAISKAVAAGAEKFWAKRLRGAAALLNGNYDDAERILLECRNNGDDSAAIYGLLTEVYLMQGKLPEAWVSLGKVRSLPKVDFEDSLFYAFASYVDPDAAMQSADRLFSDHKSPLAFLLWSRARFYLAEFSWDPQQADRAVDDGKIARKFFDNNAYVSIHQLTMLSELVKFARLQKDEARIEKYRAEGESVIGTLESSKQPGAILSSIGYFLETIGKDDEAEQIYLTAIAGGNYWAINDYTGFLVERGRYADAVARLQDAAKTSIPMKLRYAIAMGEISGRQQEAIEILQSIARDPQSGLGYQNPAMHHLGFLGHQDLAFELAKDIAETSSQQTAPAYLHSMVDVWAEKLDKPEALLEKAKNPNELWQAHESLSAYFFAKGEFEKAKRQLKQANAIPRSRLSDRTHLIWMRKISEAVAGQ